MPGGFSDFLYWAQQGTGEGKKKEGAEYRTQGLGLTGFGDK